MTKGFIYRRGDGNEGNFPRCAVILADGDSPWQALRALVVNDYISGSYTRRFIAREIETDGEPDNPIAAVFEGPRRASAYGAAWLTAELEPAEESDNVGDSDAPVYYVMGGRYVAARPIRELLDKGARAILEKGRHS